MQLLSSRVSCNGHLRTFIKTSETSAQPASPAQFVQHQHNPLSSQSHFLGWRKIADAKKQFSQCVLIIEPRRDPGKAKKEPPLLHLMRLSVYLCPVFRICRQGLHKPLLSQCPTSRICFPLNARMSSRTGSFPSAHISPEWVLHIWFVMVHRCVWSSEMDGM